MPRCMRSIAGSGMDDTVQALIHYHSHSKHTLCLSQGLYISFLKHYCPLSHIVAIGERLEEPS